MPLPASEPIFSYYGFTTFKGLLHLLQRLMMYSFSEIPSMISTSSALNVGEGPNSYSSASQSLINSSRSLT